MKQDVLLIKDKGCYIVLDMIARMISYRQKAELENETLKDFAAVVLTDTFGNYCPEDSEIWLNVFEDTIIENYPLYCILMITRFAGTRLVDAGAYWKMEPIMRKDNAAAWWTPKRWETYKRDVLMPMAEPLRQVLLKKGR